jgi:hypothetical protein
MKKYTVCFMVTAGITIEADTPDEAKFIFDNMKDEDLLDELEGNSIEMTEIFETE